RELTLDFCRDDPASTRISPLSLHDALPILGARSCVRVLGGRGRRGGGDDRAAVPKVELVAGNRGQVRIGRAGSVGAYSERRRGEDRKSTRLNSSHDQSSYAGFCLKKKSQRV